MFKYLTLFCFLSFIFNSGLMADANHETASRKLIDEYQQLRTVVSQIQPDNQDEGPYLKQKDYGNYVLLWSLADTNSNISTNERIRIYIPSQGDHQDFAVTYVKSTMIAPGQVVLRKFIGPEPSGWRNDTVDYATGEYLGRQGSSWITIPEHVKSILTQYDIEPLLF